MGTIITLTNLEMHDIYGGKHCYCRHTQKGKQVFIGNMNSREDCSHACFNKGYAFFHLDDCDYAANGVCITKCHLHPAGLMEGMDGPFSSTPWTDLCLQECRKKHHC